MKIRRALLGLGVFVACLGLHLPEARAIVLIKVLDPLTIFSITGLEFDLYSTSERGTLRVEDTEDGFMGDIELQGQTERRSDLTLFAISITDSRQQIRLEMDIRPLIGPPREGITFLQSNPMALGPITDRALEPFTEPLLFGFEFIRETPDPETGGTRSEYRLARIDQVPEPASWLLVLIGGCFLTRKLGGRFCGTK